jgi:hypothetical protein
MPNAPDAQLLVRYLLGTLPDDETERLDELSVVDDEVAADLRVAEHDLVDRHARGALSAEERRQFERHFLALPNARAKVAFARNLARHERVAAVRPSAGRSRAFALWGLATAAVLCLAAGGYLLSENLRLKRQIDEVRTASDGRQRELQQQLQDAQSTNAERARELDRARQALAQADKSPAAAAAPTRILASLVLLPPVRGAADLPVLSLPEGPGVVAVRLQLEANDFPAYRVVLRDAAGAVVWRSGTTQAVARTRAASLSLTLPADLLTARRFMLDVTGVASRGSPEPVGSYPFQVVLK